MRRSFSHRLWTIKWLLAASFCALGVVSTKVAAEDAAVSYFSDVAPLLSSHCYHCHDKNLQQGGLRLDTRDGAMKGGQSGKSLLTPDLENNELLRRLTIADSRKRMPLGSTPLSADEIEIIRRWLAQGAYWPELRGLSSDDPWWIRALLALEPFFGYWQVWWNYVDRLKYPLLAFLALVLLAERAKVLLRADHRWTRGRARPLLALLSRTPRLAYAVGATGFVCAGLTLHARFLSADNERLGRRVQELTRPNLRKDDSEPPQPFRPHHPPRLGGTYYRGNDERSSQLYNNGVYRTCTFYVGLCDTEGRALEYGAEAEGRPWFVKLSIERAPHATPALFTPSIMDRAVLSRQWSGHDLPELADQPVRLTVVEPGERWEGSYLIGRPTKEGETLQGLIYLYQAEVVNDEVHGQPHYGIRYDLSIEDGQLSPESELWMGAIFLTGNIVVPAPGTIPLTEWFDYREIPVIEGENTTDPELLGIPEHERELQQRLIPGDK